MRAHPPSMGSDPSHPVIHQKRALLAQLFAGLLLISACSAPMVPAPPTSVPTPDTPAELSVYMPHDDTLIKMLGDMIQAAPGGARVKLTFLDETYYPAEQIPWLIKQDKVPDLIFAYAPFLGYLVDAGLLLDLHDQMAPGPEFDPNAIDAQALASGHVKGRGGQYALPLMADNAQLYYNKTLLQQAKVSLPSRDWTWDELINQCKHLQTAKPSITCLALNGATDFGNWYPWVRGYSGDVLSADGTQSTLSSRHSIEGLQHYQELWTKHKVVSPVQFPTYVDCFVSQRCAMILSNSGTGRTLSERVGGTFTWDTQLMPQFPQGRYTTGWVMGFGVGAASKHPAAAWALLRSLVSPEAQGALLTGGYGLPVLQALPAAGGRPLPAYLQPFLDGRSFSVGPPAYPTSQACTSQYDSVAWMAINEALSAVFYNKGDFAQALPQADKKIQKCLDSAQSPSAK